MAINIAVDESLENLRDLLSEEGFGVIDATDYEKADAVVVTGLDNNMMNMQETDTSVPVIDASGKRENEIVSELKERL